MATCTIFKNFTIPIESKWINLIGKDIISEKYKTEIDEIRKLLAQGLKQEADAKKKQLLAFTPSATFTEKRQMPFMEKYSGFVHLDFDKLTVEHLKIAKEIISKIPYTQLCFTSPSGNGLKVFVEVDTGLEHHDIAYQQVQKFYEDATGLKADPSCKDVTRLCFISYDPDAYRTIEHKKFIVTAAEKPIKETFVPQRVSQVPKQAEPVDLSQDFIFNQQIQFTNNKTQYSDGNRNNYIYQLASNCNRAGLDMENVISLITNGFDLPHREIKETVRSAYGKHPQEFAKFANIAKPAMLQSNTTASTISNDDDNLEDYLKSTPCIPDEVFDQLPDILKQGCFAFDDRRKRDVFFTGAIAILSGCLPKVTGIYHNERVYTHLYTFIIAPPASGKGVLKNAKRLADKHHQKVLEQSRAMQTRYDAEMIEFKNESRGLKKGDTPPEQPEKPAFKIVFIPADSSHSRMIEHLQMNEGQGIICETEADTMSGAKKQDWGDYSPALRSAFHHEKITFTRKTNNEYIEINEPRLAVALSGTPAQAPKLISSAEDGLFSRFLFYAFKNDILWQDPSPIGKTVVYNDHFEALSIQVLDLIGFLDQSPTEIHLSGDQWQILNTTFAKMLSDVTTFTSEEASGIVFRLGLIMYRICMIFTALRKFENGDMAKEYICTDEDFNIALQVVKTYLSHSILMFNNLPKQGDNMTFVGGDNKRKFFDALPKEFSRKEAVAIGTTFKLSPRSVDDVLKMALGHTLERVKAGSYTKVL
jgi:Protein of unknown function (DUF3987)/VirE N-terminal domain